MSGGSEKRSVSRSIGAVVAGVIATVLPTLATDALMHGTGVFPPEGEPMSNGLFGVALAYRLVYGVLGGFVTAKLAPGNPMFHALVLGAIGTIASIGGAVAMWHLGQHWYPLAIIVTALPCAWLGAKLARRR